MRVCVTRTCHVTPSKCVAYSCPVQRLGAAFVVGRVHNSHIPLDRRAVVVNEHTLITTRDATISQSTPRIGTGVLFHG